MDGVEKQVFYVSNGEIFVDASIRRGIPPQLLEEILETLVMVNNEIKRIVNYDGTSGLFNRRQLGLKMITEAETKPVLKWRAIRCRHVGA